MFDKARLKLTGWYLLIIMFISISFSLVIYKVLTNEVDRFASAQRFRIERRLQERVFFPLMDPELVEEVKHRLLLMLAAINGAILLLSGGLGYFLAGRTLKPIKEMLEDQNRFISDASHELRTPLTSLKTAMEVNLRNKNLTLKEAKTLILENIEDVNKLQALSVELLQHAQYQKPNNHTKFEKFSLAEVVKKVIRKLEPIAKKRKVSIKNDSEDILIEGNKDGIYDLLIIILDNAIKYSLENKTVAIKVRKTNGNIKISIQDQGIGINLKDLPHIFDRFYRADTARSKTKTNGYGLGLSIAKKIIDIHHGTIIVKSKLNQGSTFLICLPKKQSALTK